MPALCCALAAGHSSCLSFAPHDTHNYHLCPYSISVSIHLTGTFRDGVCERGGAWTWGSDGGPHTGFVTVPVVSDCTA